MGIPKFFRWISERYPKVNQRETFLVEPETYREYFGKENDIPGIPPPKPDLLSTCEAVGPEIDRLYLDGNGILHGCSHNNNNEDGTPNHITQEEICRNVVYYLDRVIMDMVKPKELVYIAIDGVAPRAKLNQQRARRYRGSDQELEVSVYEEFLSSKKANKDNKEGQSPQKIGDRLTGKFTTTDEGGVSINDDGNDDDDDSFVFHTNCITPGTEFFSVVVRHIEHWLEYKVSTDERWKD
eukprot:CAMPEP_0194196246 /NCGR_PEP_ID=MMETSP0154-20130528/76567_1 /TAXON_ID=1049557 /ORGANISM="Thalassiothrix antarctica, Strain L6-D1" /LENGTH=238 /DNA_ID=CAMNT_0038920831 /DNA_START=210 /DNA_END=923 /DNA_ORIENTATION=-